jgi:DNA-binding response OmpR family regulator
MFEKKDRSPIQNPDTPILFVDDDPTIHRLMAKYLKDWDVTSASSGQEALELLEKENFVIVITDLRMPGIDGMELLHRIKAKYNNRVQVIVVTVSDDLDDLVGALDGGASDFLLKPLKKEVLTEVLRHTVSRIDRWNKSLNLLINKNNPL